MVAELTEAALSRALEGSGLPISVGPIEVRIHSPLASVRAYLASHYTRFPVAETNGAHFSVDVLSPGGVRRFVGRQAVFESDGHRPYHPVPEPMAAAVFEWGFNWCMANRMSHLLAVHSAVVARGDAAALLPAPPESGKSTLCAALVSAGWRLSSDEFALIDVHDGRIRTLPRPISLKEQSIGLIASRWRDACFSPEVTDLEGTRIRYLRPPDDSIAKARSTARPRWVIVPRYEAGSPTRLEPLTRARVLSHLADSSYNFSDFGAAGFECLRSVADQATGYTLTYSRLDEALDLFDRLERDLRDEPTT
jgi:HprK-related kinase A